MKNFKKIANIIRLYGITASVIWYLIGMSFWIDSCDKWEQYVLASNNINSCLEYFFVSIFVVITLSYFFEYILKKEQN